MKRRIIFVEEKTPLGNDEEKMIEWFLTSLGLILKKDQKEGIKKVFKEVITISKNKEYFTIDDIANNIDLSRTTAYHHLNKLVDVGILLKTRKGYTLTSSTLEGCILELEYEMHRILDKIKRISRELDELLDL